MNSTFLSDDAWKELAANFGSPIYVYDAKRLQARAAEVLAFPHAFGLTARYAMKANPNASIVRLLNEAGLHLDISSGYEAQRALLAGIPANHLSISSQELPHNLVELIAAGAKFNATSLQQLRAYGELLPGTTLGLRINPGMGSGGNNRTNVGGPSSSFGLWHESIQEAHEICEAFQLHIERIHTHIGSGSDPAVWQKVAGMSLDIVRKFPEVHTLNLGGGFKVGRMPDETSTDLQVVGAPVKAAFEAFAKETGRELNLEIEPGTYLVANMGHILCQVQDIVHTGGEGYQFLRTNAGMTEILRPSLYGAQQPMTLIPAKGRSGDEEDYVVVGHCCESGDILTPAPGDPEAITTRHLHQAAIGDLLVIGGAGAYCSAMPAKNYNSFPEAAEVLVNDGEPRLIRKRQNLEQVIANEV